MFYGSPYFNFGKEKYRVLTQTYDVIERLWRPLHCQNLCKTYADKYYLKSFYRTLSEYLSNRYFTHYTVIQYRNAIQDTLEFKAIRLLTNNMGTMKIRKPIKMFSSFKRTHGSNLSPPCNTRPKKYNFKSVRHPIVWTFPRGI